MGLPADKNIALDDVGNPVGVNLVHFTSCSGCPDGTAALAGTGMEAGTGWITVTAPVVPGETITLELMIFDVTDGLVDSAVLLDGFKWSPDSSVAPPTPVGGSVTGIIPQKITCHTPGQNEVIGGGQKIFNCPGVTVPPGDKVRITIDAIAE
jgi:hypothetical protein